MGKEKETHLYKCFSLTTTALTVIVVPIVRVIISAIVL